MVHIDIRCCAAMKAGLFFASEGIEDISNFAPHFCTPQSMKSTRIVFAPGTKGKTWLHDTIISNHCKHSNKSVPNNTP